MYLKKIGGPRAVTLSDGTVMTRADLPDPNCRRWVASRKAAVVRAVSIGLIGMSEACEIYSLSQEELEGWSNAVSSFGEDALKATSVQKFRQPTGD